MYFRYRDEGRFATGRVERGVVKVGEEVEIVGVKETTKTTCTGVEMFRKLLDEGVAGDNIGVLLRGVKRDEIERGQVLAKPGSITPHTEFEAEVYVLSKDEGGRHTPFFKGYRPQFYFRTTDVTGEVELPEGVEMVMPGDNVQMRVKLIAPIAMEEGVAVCGARGWAHGRCRGRRKNHRVNSDEGPARSSRTPFRFRISRPVAQLAERRSPKPQVGGSIPSWPANSAMNMNAGIRRCDPDRGTIDRKRVTCRPGNH